MNILLLGSGGREHALAWKIAQSPLLTRLFIAPGNAGTAGLGTNLPVDPENFPLLKETVMGNRIDMVVVGPENPLVKGIHDFFLADHFLRLVPVIGPRKNAAMLEGSKDFAKRFMVRHHIPTANYRTFTPGNAEAGFAYLESLNPPYVLKADGLAAGKGVLICDDLSQAHREFSRLMFRGAFGKASRKIVIEEFLSGIELSVFILTDGKTWKLLPEAKDYKRIGEGDTGPNTGGMGAVSPVPFADQDFMNKVITRVIQPTMDGLLSEGIDYQGFLFFGLINVKGDPYVIEYNCRLGDPETESVIPRLKSDLVPLLKAIADRRLERETVEIHPETAATVMMVSKGYPGSYEKGTIIHPPPPPAGILLFHAGTLLDPYAGQIISNGGRVLAITHLANNLPKALDGCYQSLPAFAFDGCYYRKDIGQDLISPK
ncbi:MAG TPA: phosphoribosylamine--glycine ligase [Bacteroidales bacterium]|nr:phosphoribosylamine--glycine ligase [Bacteroidales bacterium]HPT09954.1 phosphoribosylamine--glycine ligase [Bacteroidales bacterium]